MSFKTYWFIFILFFGISSLGAQISDKSKIYNLQEVLQTSLRNNYDLRLNQASVDYSEVDMKNAFGRYLPNINFTSGYQRQLNNRQTGVISPGNDYYSMNLGANLAIFDGFSREANYSRAQSSLKASKLSLDQMIQIVYLDAYNEYINVVRSTQIVRIRQENIDLTKSDLERTRARYEAGVLPITSVYAQEADLGNKEIELINAENELNSSKARLLTIMGLAPDMTVEFDATSIPSRAEDLDLENFKGEIGSFPNAIATALDNRMDYQAAQLRAKAADFSLRMANSSYYPMLSASADWRWANDAFNKFDQGNYYFGLNFTVPIFSNFSTDLQVQNMKFALEQNDVELLKLEQNIRSSVQISYLNLQSAEKQVEISKKTVFSAQQNYNSTNERMQVGAATTNDLILAATQLITAQINQINAVYNYVRSRNDIKFALGTIYK